MRSLLRTVRRREALRAVCAGRGPLAAALPAALGWLLAAVLLAWPILTGPGLVAEGVPVAAGQASPRWQVLAAVGLLGAIGTAVGARSAAGVTAGARWWRAGLRSAPTAAQRGRLSLAGAGYTTALLSLGGLVLAVLWWKLAPTLPAPWWDGLGMLVAVAGSTGAALLIGAARWRTMGAILIDADGSAEPEPPNRGPAGGGQRARAGGLAAGGAAVLVPALAAALLVQLNPLHTPVVAVTWENSTQYDPVRGLEAMPAGEVLVQRGFPSFATSPSVCSPAQCERLGYERSLFAPALTPLPDGTFAQIRWAADEVERTDGTGDIDLTLQTFTRADALATDLNTIAPAPDPGDVAVLDTVPAADARIIVPPDVTGGEAEVNERWRWDARTTAASTEHGPVVLSVWSQVINDRDVLWERDLPHLTRVDIYTCEDPACAQVQVDSAPAVGPDAAAGDLVPDSEGPMEVVAGEDGASYALLRTLDADGNPGSLGLFVGEGDGTLQHVDLEVEIQQHHDTEHMADLALGPDGLPWIVTSPPGEQSALIHCLDAGCVERESTPIPPISGPSIAVDETGRPLLTGWRPASEAGPEHVPAEQVLLACGDDSCSQGSEQVLGYGSSGALGITLSEAGLPVLSAPYGILWCEQARCGLP